MFRRLLKYSKRLVSYLPTVAIIAGIAYLAYLGHENDWNWGEKKDDEKSQVKETEVESSGPLPDEIDDDRYGRSPFDRTLSITHNPAECKLLTRELTFKDKEIGAKTGIYLGTVRELKFGQVLSVTGTVEFDPTQIARVSPRVGGTISRVYKDVGDSVEPGELLAVLDAAEVGKAKAAFYQAKVQLELRKLLRDRLQVGVSPERTVIEAESAVREGQVTLATAYQALLNMGFNFNLADVEKLPDVRLARALQSLGLDDVSGRNLPEEPTNNLLPVRNPLQKKAYVLQRDAVIGESIAALQMIFVVGNTDQMLLMLDVPQENAPLIGMNQPVKFCDGNREFEGEIIWIAKEIDPKTRTLKARARLDKKDGLLKAKTFVTAQVTVGPERSRLAVPEEAIQWEGCSHIVFVKGKEKHDEKEQGEKEKDQSVTFEVRKVRLGIRRNGFVEVLPGEALYLDPAHLVSRDGLVGLSAAGVEAGEEIAVLGSHVLKSHLFKDRLGSAEE